MYLLNIGFSRDPANLNGPDKVLQAHGGRTQLNELIDYLWTQV